MTQIHEIPALAERMRSTLTALDVRPSKRTRISTSFTLKIARPYTRLKKLKGRYVERVWIEPDPPEVSDEVRAENARLAGEATVENIRAAYADADPDYTVFVGAFRVGSIALDARGLTDSTMIDLVDSWATGSMPLNIFGYNNCYADAWALALRSEDVVEDVTVGRSGRVLAIFRLGEDRRWFKIKPPVEKPRPRNALPRWAAPGRA
jgi:hypothetical protein